MKILNVNMSIDPILGGGTAERTVQMSIALAELGHQSILLSLALGINDQRLNELQNVNLVTIPCLIRRIYLPYPEFKKISNLVSSVDIVHLMGHWTILNAIVYFYIRKFKKTYVICPAGALPIFGRSKLIKKLYNLVVGYSIVRNSNAQIVIAKDEISHLENYGLEKVNATWIPNGINSTVLQNKDTSNFRKLYGLGDSPFILYIGRLNPIKGPDLLLEAFCLLKQNFPQYHLIFAGPDEGMLESLKKVTHFNHVENRVHFIGHISGKIKSQALHAATLMVIPSRQEAMSIVVLEAGIVGLPVLLTDQCGMNSLSEIEAGIIVPASTEGIYNGLLKNLDNATILNKLGTNLKSHVHDNYLWSEVVKKFERLYLNILLDSSFTK